MTPSKNRGALLQSSKVKITPLKSLEEKMLASTYPTDAGAWLKVEIHTFSPVPFARPSGKPHCRKVVTMIKFYKDMHQTKTQFSTLVTKRD